jgi:hypothetical protein
MSALNGVLGGAARQASCRLTPLRWGARSAAQRKKLTGPAAGRAMEGDEKSEGVMEERKILAAGSGLN